MQHAILCNKTYTQEPFLTVSWHCESYCIEVLQNSIEGAGILKQRKESLYKVVASMKKRCHESVWGAGLVDKTHSKTDDLNLPWHCWSAATLSLVTEKNNLQLIQIYNYLLFGSVSAAFCVWNQGKKTLLLFLPGTKLKEKGWKTTLDINISVEIQ